MPLRQNEVVEKMCNLTAPQVARDGSNNGTLHMVSAGRRAASEQDALVAASAVHEARGKRQLLISGRVAFEERAVREYDALVDL